MEEGNDPSCAACKFQRRKCGEDCVLAPYFPAADSDKFLTAHKLYGVCNMQKLLNQVSKSQKDMTMTTIKIESDIRARYPVNGSLAVIGQLLFLVRHGEERLQCARKLIGIYKNRLSVDPHVISQLHARLRFEIYPVDIEGDFIPTYEDYFGTRNITWPSLNHHHPLLDRSSHVEINHETKLLERHHNMGSCSQLMNDGSRMAIYE